MVYSEIINDNEGLGVINLDKFIGERKILDNVSFSVKKGNAIVIIGPSGVGKSTLLYCINLLKSFENGKISISGMPIAEYNTETKSVFTTLPPNIIRQKIGLVFQEWNLWPNKTVLQNIIEAPIFVLKDNKESAKNRAKILCSKVHLENKMDSYPNELSGGEKQRAAIARALAMRPEVLMLDEITSALDPILVVEVLDVIASLKKDLQTLIIVTHHISFAKAIADQILFLYEGKVHEIGTSEILDNPQTEELKHFLQTIQRTY